MTYEQYTGYASVNEHDKAIWNAAYIAGQKAMRERAAKIADAHLGIYRLSEVIRALPIEGE